MIALALNLSELYNCQFALFVFKKTAKEGLSEVSQSGLKALRQSLSKEGLAKAKEQLVTLKVAKTELMARIEKLISNRNLLSDTKKVLTKARNSLEKNLKQDDLIGAWRDKLAKPVRGSGTGEAFDHLQEVRQGLFS